MDIDAPITPQALYTAITPRAVKRYAIDIRGIRQAYRDQIVLFLAKVYGEDYSASTMRLVMTEHHTELQSIITNSIIVQVIALARFDRQGNQAQSSSPQFLVHGEDVEQILQEDEELLRRIIRNSSPADIGFNNNNVIHLMQYLWDNTESMVIDTLTRYMGADFPSAENFIAVNRVSNVPNTDIIVDVLA